MAKHPKVSIVFVTYNQEEYAREALDSFLTQKVDFSYEVVISDDHSTDSTQSILNDYADKYPHLFKLNFQAKNVGVPRNFKDALLLAEGEYVALCEGDDFWNDPTKLQRQVDFLESHKDYSLVFHPVRVFYQNGEQSDYIFPQETKGFTVERLLKRNFIQTNSVMYRKQDYKPLRDDMMPTDLYIHLYHAQHGKIGFINKVMASYRKHQGGVWWGAERKDIFFGKALIPELRLLEVLEGMFQNTPYGSSSITAHAVRLLHEAVTETKSSKMLFTQAAKEYPEYMAAAFQEYSKELNINRVLIDELYVQEKSLREEYEHKKDELEKITHSKSYRLGSKIAQPIRLVKRVLKR